MATGKMPPVKAGKGKGKMPMPGSKSSAAKDTKSNTGMKSAKPKYPWMKE